MFIGVTLNYSKGIGVSETRGWVATSESLLKEYLYGQEMRNENLIIIKGLVIPVEWDENGRVVDIAIAAFDENQYSIEKALFKKQMLKKIGQSVTIRGVIQKVKNKKIIFVADIIQGEKSDTNGDSNSLVDL